MLLAFVAMRGGKPVSRGYAASLFWGERDETAARNSLRQALWRIRQQMGSAFIADDESLRTDTAEVFVDALQFEEGVSRGEFAAAAALWGGDFLPDGDAAGTADFAHWIDEVRSRLRQKYVTTLHGLLSAAAAAGDAAKTVELAEQWIDLQPLDENAALTYARALNSAGRRSDALAFCSSFYVRYERAFEEVPDAIAAFQRSIGDAAPSIELTPHRVAQVRQKTRLLPIAAAAVVAVAMLAVLLVKSSNAIRARDRFAVSVAARRMYDAGLRSYYRNQPNLAYQFFRNAVAEDSGFAMAAFYASRTAPFSNEQSEWLNRAVRLAQRADEHDRLLINAEWAMRNGRLELRAIADTFAIRYPRESDGFLYLGNALMSAGQFMDAAAAYRRALALDSVSFSTRVARCRACDAVDRLVGAYTHADSLRLAEQAATMWVQRRPSVNAWSALGGVLEYEGRYDDARAAYETAERLLPEESDLGGHLIELAIRRGDFAAADSMIAAHITSEDVDVRANALFQRVLSYRNQGRTREALAAARELRLMHHDSLVRKRTGSDEAHTLIDMRRFTEAAVVFDSIADLPRRIYTPDKRRWTPNILAAEVTALAAVGDTARIRVLESEMRTDGRLTSEARVQNLWLYAEGLLQQQRGNHAGAITALRIAMASPTNGYVRASLALARSQMTIGRSRDAIPVLQAAIRGALGAGGAEVTKTELHLALAQAFDAGVNSDSAAVHYAWVAHALAHADSEWQSRRLLAQERLSELRRHEISATVNTSPAPRRTYP